jgi:putative transposase
VSEKYALIAAEKADPTSPYSVRLMCLVLTVSSSAFYSWLSARPSARALRRAKLEACVQAAFDAGRGTYGVRRVHAILARSADPDVATASLQIVRDIMRDKGLRACQRRAYRVTTVPDPAAQAAIADHVRRDFTAEAPGCKLVGDITYVRTWEGWLYLATVIDCHTKGIVGWSMAEHMRTDLVCDAITMAAGNVSLAEDALFHSDRGAQYTSAQFTAHLAERGITGSMGRTGVCWDNALAESFFAALKNELVHRTAFPTRETARRAIAEYIEVFYNRQRLHSGLGYKTPLEVATEYQQNIALAA